eukprot:EG_transcript_24373
MAGAPTLCSGGFGYHTSLASVPRPRPRPRGCHTPLWAAGLALMLMALVLLLPTVVSTRLEVAGDDAEVQKGEASKTLLAHGLRHLYSTSYSYFGALVGSELGATTGQALNGGRGRSAGEHIGKLYGRAVAREMGRGAAERQIARLGWAEGAAEEPAGKARYVPADVGGRLGRWAGAVAGGDLGEVRGRLAAAKGRQQRDPLNEFCGGMVGYVLGRKAGASVGEVVGRTVQVAVERADDPQASSRQGPDNEAPLGNNGAMSI